MPLVGNLPKTISFDVTSDDFDYIDNEARKQNMSVSMFCKLKCVPKNNSKVDITKLYDDLLKRVSNCQMDVAFTLRALMGNDWDDIPDGTKRAMGRLFYSQVKSGLIENVQIEGRLIGATMHYSKKEGRRK